MNLAKGWIGGENLRNDTCGSTIEEDNTENSHKRDETKQEEPS